MSTAPMDLTDDDLKAIEKAATAAKSIADFDHAALAAYVVAVNPTVLLDLVATVRESRQKLSDARAALRLREQWFDHPDVRGALVMPAMRGIEPSAEVLALAKAANDASASVLNAAAPVPVAVPATRGGSRCAHGNEDCGICDR